MRVSKEICGAGYSARSASIGLTEAARRAGINDASNTRPKIEIVAIAITAGSNRSHYPGALRAECEMNSRFLGWLCGREGDDAVE